MNDDFLDILRNLSAQNAQFLVVGAHALAGHGVIRATGDLDIWVKIASDNSARVWRALVEFGAPVDTLGIHPDDFLAVGAVVKIGLPPRRIDLMTSITGVEFADAWRARIEVKIADVTVPVLGRAALLTNKRALGRAQDLVDVEALARLGPNAE